MITYPDDTPAVKITMSLNEGLPGLPVKSTQSREDGTFQFEDVTDGLYEITAAAPSGDINLRVSQKVEVAGHDLDRVNLALEAPFSDGILDETLIALATSVTVRAGEMALADLHLIARPLF